MNSMGTLWAQGEKLIFIFSVIGSESIPDLTFLRLNYLTLATYFLWMASCFWVAYDLQFKPGADLNIN